MQVEELAEGLWRWTGQLPGGEEVGSVYLESADGVVLVDPIVPPEDAGHFLAALDRDVRRLDGRGVIALTSERHARDTAALLGRYGGLRRAEPSELDGVAVFDAGAGEVMLLLEQHAALVVGDALVGVEGGLAFGRAPFALRAELLERRVDRVLVSHGAPVLASGSDALARLASA